MRELSVVIPTLDEARALPATLRALGRAFPGAELLVVDGGSRDRTREVARAAGARVLLTRPSRGAQLALGAEAARGELLAFVHADSRVDPRAGAAVAAFFADPTRSACAFRAVFPGRHPALRFMSWLTRFDHPLTTYGDQGLVLRRSVYRAAGGFPTQGAFEDVEFCARVRRVSGAIAKLTPPLVTSARRFEAAGVLRQQAFNAGLHLLYHRGVDPAALAALYRGGLVGQPVRTWGPAFCAAYSSSP